MTRNAVDVYFICEILRESGIYQLAIQNIRFECALAAASWVLHSWNAFANAETTGAERSREAHLSSSSCIDGRPVKTHYQSSGGGSGGVRIATARRAVEQPY